MNWNAGMSESTKDLSRKIRRLNSTLLRCLALVPMHLSTRARAVFAGNLVSATVPMCDPCLSLTSSRQPTACSKTLVTSSTARVSESSVTLKRLQAKSTRSKTEPLRKVE